MQTLILFAESQYHAALMQFRAAEKLLDGIRNAHAQVSRPDEKITWVYIDRLSELTGLSKNGIRNRIARKFWTRDIHYKHETTAPRSRLIFNLEEINKRMDGGH